MYGSPLIQNVSIKQQAKPRLLGLTPVSTPVQGYLSWKRSHMEVLHKCASRKSSTSGGQAHQQREERAVSVELAIIRGWIQLLLKLSFTAAGSAHLGQYCPAEAVLHCSPEEMQSCIYCCLLIFSRYPFSAPQLLAAALCCTVPVFLNG